MDFRETALVEIYNRISDNKTVLGLNGFKRSPTRPIDEKYLINSGLKNCCGHIHNSRILREDLYFNTSVEVLDYKPIRFSKIVKRFK